MATSRTILRTPAFKAVLSFTLLGPPAR
jgi:hypothetical protein